MRILGVDPGTLQCGWGIVDQEQSDPVLRSSGTIRIRASLTLPERLHRLFQELKIVIEKHSPQAIALEDTFLAKNVKAAFSLGQARGIVVLLSSLHKIPVSFYTALQIKKTVTGYGRAEKTQVSQMLGYYFPGEKFSSLDSSDAIACALCHLRHRTPY